VTDINFYAAVAKPGDILIVAVPDVNSRRDADEVAGELEKLLPGIRVIAVCAQSIAVYRPDDDG
jgi:septum formation inhibitor-activating ATPase MinD